MDPQEVGWGGIDWIALAQNRDRWRVLVNAVMNVKPQTPLAFMACDRGKFTSTIYSISQAQRSKA